VNNWHGRNPQRKLASERLAGNERCFVASNIRQCRNLLQPDPQLPYLLECLSVAGQQKADLGITVGDLIVDDAGMALGGLVHHLCPCHRLAHRVLHHVAPHT
jgi:hypothetical protein